MNTFWDQLQEAAASHHHHREEDEEVKDDLRETQDKKKKGPCSLATRSEEEINWRTSQKTLKPSLNFQKGRNTHVCHRNEDPSCKVAKWKTCDAPIRRK